MANRLLVMVLLLTVALVAALPTSVHADASDLDKAWNSLGEPNYRSALRYATRALEAGGSSPDQLVDIYSVLGITLAGLGRTEEAKLAFEKMLAIRPSAGIPTGYAPKITRVFRSARADARARAPLSMSFEQGDCSRGLSIILIIEKDPLAMVVGGRAVYAVTGAAEREIIVSGTDRIEIAVPQKRAAIRLAALDEYQNRLVELGSARVPLVVECGGADSSDDASAAVALPRRCSATAACSPGARCVDSLCIASAASSPLYVRWSLWAGAAVGVAGVAVYFGLRARADERELDDLVTAGADYSLEILPAEERWRSHAALANTGFVVAGVAGVVSAVLLWRKLRRERRKHKLGASVEALPLRGGAMVGVQLPF